MRHWLNLWFTGLKILIFQHFCLYKKHRYTFTGILLFLYDLYYQDTCWLWFLYISWKLLDSLVNFLWPLFVIPKFHWVHRNVMPSLTLRFGQRSFARVSGLCSWASNLLVGLTTFHCKTPSHRHSVTLPAKEPKQMTSIR